MILAGRTITLELQGFFCPNKQKNFLPQLTAIEQRKTRLHRIWQKMNIKPPDSAMMDPSQLKKALVYS